MTKTTVLKWRLSERPTADNILKLVEGGVLTKDEAKKIALDESEVSQSDIEAVKSELSLLRKMVLELSERTNTSPMIIKIIERESPTIRPWPYYQPYITWCANTIQTMGGMANYQAQTNCTTGNGIGFKS